MLGFGPLAALPLADDGGVATHTGTGAGTITGLTGAGVARFQKKTTGNGGGTDPGTAAAGEKYATREVMPETGTITALILDSAQTKTVNTRMALYANDGGVPGALLAVSSDKSSVVTGENYYTLPTGIVVTVGQTFWVALHTDASINWLLGNEAGGSYKNADTFAGGVANPFGSGTVENKRAPLLAVYIEGVAAEIHHGVGAGTLTGPTGSAAAAHGRSGSGAGVITAPTGAASGLHIVPVTGAGAGSLDPPIGAGEATSGPAAVTGSGAAALTNVNGSASGAHGVAGSGSGSVAGPTGAGSGSFVEESAASGSGAGVIAGPVGSGEGTHEPPAQEEPAAGTGGGGFIAPARPTPTVTLRPGPKPSGEAPYAPYAPYAPGRAPLPAPIAVPTAIAQGSADLEDGNQNQQAAQGGPEPRLVVHGSPLEPAPTAERPADHTGGAHAGGQHEADREGVNELGDHPALAVTAVEPAAVVAIATAIAVHGRIAPVTGAGAGHFTDRVRNDNDFLLMSAA